MAGGRAVKGGEAYVEIGIRNRIAAGAKGVQSDLDKLGRKVTALGGIIGGIGLTLGTPFALATSKLAAFDDAMRSVGAISQATGSDLKRLTDTAKELGRTTSFTAVEVATLMTELGRAGFDSSQIDDMTGAVLNLSRATGTDAALSAGILAASIRQYGLAATDAARVSDGLTAAANKSFNTVEALGEAMSYAGPVAAEYGMSIEETLAVLGTLGNIGIQGSAAGTAIRRLLTITGAEAEKMQEIFGISFMDAAGNARPLIDTLGEISLATNDLGTAARGAKFNEAFGLLGITAAGALGKTAAETRNLLKEIQGASGIAAKTAEQMDAGLGGSFRKIMSAVEGAAIAIAESFGPSIQAVTDSITSAIGGFTAWVESNKSLVMAVAATTAGLVALGATMITIGVTSQLAAAGIGTLASVAAMAISVWKGAVTIMAALRAVTLATAAVFAGTQATLTGMAGALTLFNAASLANSTIAGITAAAWAAVGSVWAGIGGIAAGTTSIGAVMGAVLSSSAAAAGSAWAAAWAVIAGPLTPFIIAGAAAVAVIGSLVGLAGYAAIKGMEFGKAWEIVKQTLGGLITVVKETFDAIKAALGNSDYAAAAEVLWLGVQAAFWTGADGAMKAFGWMFSEAWQATKTFFSSLVDYAIKAMGAVAKAIANPLNAYSELQKGLAEMASATVSFSVSDKATDARARLAEKTRELRLTKEQADAEKKAAKEAEERNNQRAKSSTTEVAIAETQQKTSEKTKEQLDEISAMQEKQQNKRVDGIFRRSGELRNAGVSPDEIFQRVMKQIDSDLKSGKITGEKASVARDTARANLDDDMERMRQEGRALAESLRTPGEKLSAELKRISQLQDNGAIDDNTATRAEDRARKDFAEEQKRIQDQANGINDGMSQEQKSVGPNATFSAAAASIIGSGGRFESESLKVQRETANNTAMIAKRAKERELARLG